MYIYKLCDHSPLMISCIGLLISVCMRVDIGGCDLKGVTTLSPSLFLPLITLYATFLATMV